MAPARRNPGAAAARSLSYPDAEALCAHLAAALARSLGGADASSVGPVFVPIPRGGLIVLGMLSYLLDLPASQISTSLPRDGLAVVVDDCSLSGARFSSFVEGATCRIVFAHLLSHPDLRQAILTTEPRVEAVVAAENLRERRTIEADERRFQTSKWRERLAGRRYWYGEVEPFAFPWNEPDNVLWNEKEQRIEDHWHYVAPRRALGVWRDLGMPRVEDPGSLDLAPGATWKREGDEFVVWSSVEDRAYGFADSAADMWRALLAFGDLDRAHGFLAERYDVPAGELRRDLEQFLGTLVERGLLISGPVR